MTPHEWMLVILAVAAALIIISFWRFHRNSTVPFNGLDLIMVDGKVDRIATVFMIAFAVSTWVIVDLQIKSKLDAGIFGLWMTAWVGPLVVKIVFGKNEMPVGITSTSTLVQQTTEVKTP